MMTTCALQFSEASQRRSSSPSVSGIARSSTIVLGIPVRDGILEILHAGGDLGLVADAFGNAADKTAQLDFIIDNKKPVHACLLWDFSPVGVHPKERAVSIP